MSIRAGPGRLELPGLDSNAADDRRIFTKNACERPGERTPDRQ
jgi:hypothetical protein